jgi:hypothetical protein
MAALRLAPAVERFFSLLGYRGPDDSSAAVTARISAALEGHGVVEPPIRLTPVAREFLIHPSPVFDANIREGRISFDSESGWFRIRLNPASGRNGASVNVAAPSAVRRRLRFTYAHEFAHRFFFVEHEGTWNRAASLATHSQHGTQICGVVAFQEEQMCNRIAADILVPEGVLVRMAMDHGWPASIDQKGLLALTSRIAEGLDVTLECVLVRLERAIGRGALAWQDDQIALIIRLSDSTVEGRGSFVPRLQIGFLPGWMSRAPYRSHYPKMAVDRWGIDFAHNVQALLRHETPGTCGHLKTTLRIPLTKNRRSTEGRSARMRLDGTWRLSESRDVVSPPSRSLFLCGSVARES